MTGLLGGILDPILSPILDPILKPLLDPTTPAEKEASRVFCLLKWGPWDGPKMSAQINS